MIKNSWENLQNGINWWKTRSVKTNGAPAKKCLISIKRTHKDYENPRFQESIDEDSQATESACRTSPSRSSNNTKLWKQVGEANEQRPELLMYTLGERDPQTLECMQEVVTSVSYREKPQEAEAVLARLVGLGTEKLEEDHPDTLRSRGQHAFIIRDWTDETVQREVLQNRNDLFGRLHLDVLVSTRNLGYQRFFFGKDYRKNMLGWSMRTLEETVHPSRDTTHGTIGIGSSLLRSSPLLGGS